MAGLVTTQGDSVDQPTAAGFAGLRAAHMSRRTLVARWFGLMALGAVAMPRGAFAQTPEATPEATADLAGLKAYMVEHAAAQKAGADTLVADAQQYYDLANEVNFDYQQLWDTQQDVLVPLLMSAKEVWVEQTHGNYELNEGMIAGIPSLTPF